MVRLLYSCPTFPGILIWTAVLYFCRSAIEIDTRNPEHPKLNLEVVIDGKVAYKWVPPVISSTWG
jgi:hypothetical protein